MMFVPDSQQIHSPSSFGSWFLCPDIYWASHELHWMNFRDVCSRETSGQITYGSEFWCRFTWSVRWSDRENAREQRLQRFKDDCCGASFTMKVAISRGWWLFWRHFFDEGGSVTDWGHQAFHLAFIWQLSRINGVSTSMTLLWPDQQWALRLTLRLCFDKENGFSQHFQGSHWWSVITVSLTQTLVGSF